MKIDLKNVFSYLIVFLIYFSYICGFFLNENSIGSGTYNGDIDWIWRNFEIFKNNSIINAITHKDFFGNRTPLLYLINYLFNPFINNIYSYRISIFIFSLLGPFLLYKCLKIKFKYINKKNLLIISSIIMLSPYYRTAAYWGMEINYAIISMLATYFFYLKIDFKNNNLRLQNLLFLILFSSLSIYFDQKFLFLPLLVFFKIISSNFTYKTKIISFFFYGILALPYVYLIYKWQGIVPLSTQQANTFTVTNLSRINFLHIEHLGYATSIIAFYTIPLFILIKFDSSQILKNKIFSKELFLILTLIIIYLIYLILNINFEFYTIEKYSRYNFGLGITHKLSILLFENIKIREIFTYLSFAFSSIILFLFFEKKLTEIFILIFFYFFSLFVFPIMQEYFDLVITFTFLLIFNKKIKINFKRTILFTTYFALYLVGCVIYYM